MPTFTPPPYTYQRRPFDPLTESDNSLIAKLPLHFQTILRQEGDINQISQRLDMPVGTVKSRLHRARAALTALRLEQPRSRLETE